MTLAKTNRALACLALAAAFLLAGCDSDKKEPITGKRLSVLELDKRLVPDPKLAGEPILLPAPFDNPAWPDAGGYPNHAMYHLDLGDKIHRAWRNDIGEGAARYSRVLAQPVVADGRVFAMDGETEVSAYDAKSGDRLWRFDTSPKGADIGGFGGGIAYADGKLYIATGYAEVLALNAADGKVIWRQPLSGPCTARPPSPTAGLTPSPWTTSSTCWPRTTATGCGRITAFPSRPASWARPARRSKATSWWCLIPRASFSRSGSRTAAGCGPTIWRRRGRWAPCRRSPTSAASR